MADEEQEQGEGQQQMSEEQVQALKEKLKQMSPEELKEFQKKQCIFCQIITGKIQSRKVYEDEGVVAVLDINPANPGHVLVMPREHYTIMPQVPEEELEHLILVAKTLSNAALRSLEAQGSNLVIANGVAAGQKAQHFMLHLIPRKENDKVEFQLPQKQIKDGELQKIQKTLLKSLGSKREEEESQQPAPYQQQATAPQQAPQQQAVEAEFEEKPKQEEKRPQPAGKKRSVEERKQAAGEPAAEQEKPASREEPKKKKAPAKKKTREKSDADLDDIANVLGVK